MPNTLRFETKSPHGTKRAAGRILRMFLSHGRRPLILALEGELGSGKTTFIQGLAQALGIKEKVLSPTFVLMKIFSLEKKPFRNFIHLDAYRIEKPKELLRLGFRELIRDPQNLVVIEWADRIKELIPKNAIWIHLVHKDKDQRLITTEMTND